MKRFMLVAMFLVVLPIQAHASFSLPGNLLVNNMREYEKTEDGRASSEYAKGLSYIAFVSGESSTLFMLGLICPNESVTMAQILAIVTKYLKEHPEEWHATAEYLVFDALKLAFPCRK